MIINISTAHCWVLVFNSFLRQYTVGRAPWMGGSVCPSTLTHAQNTNRKQSPQISVPVVGVEQATSVILSGETLHDIDRSVSAIGGHP
jgi:hypothetical protein